MSSVFASGPAARLRESVVGIVDRERGAAARVRPDGVGGGAGVAWGARDLFVTSAHVVTGIGVTVITPDGRALAGDVIRRDGDRDLAVVHAPGAGVPPAAIGDPYSLRPGSLVFAVGHPFGVKDAVCVGVLQATSTLPRGYRMNGKGSLRWIQADVRLAPGNSGGPLADAQGNVIGVTAMIVSGLALAVPAPDVQRLFLGLA